MSMTTVDSINRSVQTTQEWLQDLETRGHLDDAEQAYSALRSVLQALRDRLTVDEAVHLSAQLPMVLRGVYFEGWKPSATPTREETVAEFADSVTAKQSGGIDVDPVHASRSVFALLSQRVTGGEIDQVKGLLPEELRQLWPNGG